MSKRSEPQRRNLTKEEVERINRMLIQGVSIGEIARQMGRSYICIWQRARRPEAFR